MCKQTAFNTGPALSSSLVVLVLYLPETLSARLNRVGRETENSPPSSDKVKSEWSLTSILCPNGMVLNWEGYELSWHST
jgi:hypothetical protein